MSTDVVAAATTPPTMVQKLTAEAVGTAVLVFIGCGAAVLSQVDLVATGLAFGITIVMMAYAFGRISGGHFNPAVSVGAALAGRISWKETGFYAGAQFVGGLVGALLLAITLLASDVGWEFGDGPIGANGFGDHSGMGMELFGALLLETILTFIFLMVILAVTDERNDTVAFAPLAIGLSLAAIHFVGINATGTSVNPARSFGPAVFGGGDAIGQVWLFILAPLLGGAIAGLLYPALFGRGAAAVAGSGLNFGGSSTAVPGFGAPNAFEQQWNQQATGTQQMQAAPAQQEPIIQDGWQWDPAAQQWIPAQQQPPAQQGWNPPGGGDATQFREQ